MSDIPSSNCAYCDYWLKQKYYKETGQIEVLMWEPDRALRKIKGRPIHQKCQGRVDFYLRIMASRFPDFPPYPGNTILEHDTDEEEQGESKEKEIQDSDNVEKEEPTKEDSQIQVSGNVEKEEEEEDHSTISAFELK